MVLQKGKKGHHSGKFKMKVVGDLLNNTITCAVAAVQSRRNRHKSLEKEGRKWRLRRSRHQSKTSKAIRQQRSPHSERTIFNQDNKTPSKD